MMILGSCFQLQTRPIANAWREVRITSFARPPMRECGQDFRRRGLRLPLMEAGTSSSSCQMTQTSHGWRQRSTFGIMKPDFTTGLPMTCPRYRGSAAEQPNMRLKLAGGDRFKGSRVLCAGAHELSFNTSALGGRVARSLSAIR